MSKKDMWQPEQPSSHIVAKRGLARGASLMATAFALLPGKAHMAAGAWALKRNGLSRTGRP